MKCANKTILIAMFVLISGCAGDLEHRVYDNIKNRDDRFKSPTERAMSPTPSYEAYRKERESLKKNPTKDEN